MAAVELRHAGPLAYREALPAGEASGPAVVLVHGFPESSLMWEPLMERLAAAGRRCVAPDLYNLGDSQETGPATFERSLEAFTGLMDDLDLGEVAVVVHDWGGFIGLAWSCDHPDQVKALVISDTGFFSDGRWHGMADTIRGPEGEAIVEGLDREGFGAMLNGDGNAFSQEVLDAYWEPFEEGRGRRATLDFYRSLDFKKLAPWDGKLAAARRSGADPLGRGGPLRDHGARPSDLTASCRTRSSSPSRARGTSSGTKSPSAARTR